MIDGRRRTVLSIAVPQFGDDQDDDETRVAGWRSLPFAQPLSERLVEQLRRFHYVDQAALHCPPAEELGSAVKQLLKASATDDVVIVHVLSHGFVDSKTRKLRVVGGDGVHIGDTEVERWLTDLEGASGDPARASGPRTLFLLDLCYSGAAARLDWQGNVNDEHRRAWVLAASEQDAPAYSGRFTEAAVQVLKTVADGGLDTAAALPYVPLSTVAREQVPDRLRRAAAAHDVRGQAARRASRRCRRCRASTARTRRNTIASCSTSRTTARRSPSPSRTTTARRCSRGNRPQQAA